MKKKAFQDLENGNKNMGGVSALFTPAAKIGKMEETGKEGSLDKTQAFSMVFPIECYLYVRELLNYKTRQGNLSCSIKGVVLEGLELLKIENPLVKEESELERRHYRGGAQKSKVESYATSVIITKRSVNWIDNYILQERQRDEFFSKPDFIINLVDQLKKKYGKSL